MKLTYTPQDAQDWGNFSGDFNPIHFDLAQAKALGLAHLTVHGMRALLDMKHHQSQLLTQSYNAAESYCFSARLRREVKVNSAHQTVSIAKNQGIYSQLIEQDSGECCFSSKLTAMKLPSFSDVTLGCALMAPELRALYQQYSALHQVYGTGLLPLWSFLDAVLFRHMVFAPDTLLAVKQFLPQLPSTNLADVFSQVPVMQTHHEVFFCHELLSPWHDDIPVNELHLGLLPPMILGDATQGFVIHLGVVGIWQPQVKITTLITLKTKSFIANL